MNVRILTRVIGSEMGELKNIAYDLVELETKKYKPGGIYHERKIGVLIEFIYRISEETLLESWLRWTRQYGQ